MAKAFTINNEFTPAGDQPAAIQALLQGLSSGVFAQTLLGVTGSGKTFTIANVIVATQRPTIILAPNKTLAAQLYGEMKSFFPNNAVEYFVSYYDYYQPEAYLPVTDTYIAKDAAINEQIERMRLSATKSLLERQDVIIVATVSAIYGLGDPQAYLAMVLQIRRGDIVDLQQLLKQLANLQYTRNDVSFERATYRVRGDVLDIYPAEADNESVRVELFGNEVDKISLFDPLTGKIIQQISRITIYPKTHYVTPRERILQAVAAIKLELSQQINYFQQTKQLVAAQRIEQRTLYDIELLLELGYCTGIENYSRYLSGRAAGQPPPTLMDYLPKNALLVIDESHVTIPQLIAMYRGDRARKENLVNYGFRLPSALDNRPLQFTEFQQLQPQTIFVSATPGAYELEASHSEIIEQIVRPTGLVDPEIIVRPASNQVDDILTEIKHCAVANERVLITTLTKRMAENLTKYLAEHEVRVRYLHSDIGTVERVEIIRDLRLGKFDVLVGINLLREGLDMPEVSLVAIFDADKEGFLRSERSLIQTIGRAARNINGKAILYADKITGSISRAIAETNRRRTKQMQYNKQHNIIPMGINKAIIDIMEDGQFAGKNAVNNAKVTNNYQQLSTKELTNKIKATEAKMYRHARDLEFEQAAALRDELQLLQLQLLKS